MDGSGSEWIEVGVSGGESQYTLVFGRDKVFLFEVNNTVLRLIL